MIRAASAALFAALVLLGCGPSEALDVQVNDMEALLAESRNAVTSYADDDDGSSFTPDVCAAHRARYCDGMIERLERMKARANGLDSCVMGMGHDDAPAMGAMAAASSAAVEDYRRDGCRGATAASNQAQAKEHAQVMYGHFHEMEERCGGLRQMQMQAMRCGG